MPRYFDKSRVFTLIDLLNPARKTRIVDIGANPINDCPYHPLLGIDGCEVWGFEPHPDAFAQLVTKASPNEHYLPHAIGDGEMAELNICRSSGFTSLLPPNIETLDYLGRWHKAMTVSSTMKVETKRLDDLADLPKPDLLKIDVQGAEVSVFDNGTSKLNSAVAIITEVAFVELYENQPLIHHQAAALEKIGFSLTKFMFLKSKSLGSRFMGTLHWRKHQNQLIDGDAVFIRKLTDPAVYSDEQLKHLAICADAVFESFDLTLKCLDILLSRGKISEQAAYDYVKLIPHQK